jgi:hypothetical protein
LRKWSESCIVFNNAIFEIKLKNFNQRNSFSAAARIMTTINVGIAEANNVNKLGTYAFAYGMVTLSVFSGMLATLVMCEAPLHGTFGCVTLLRCGCRIVALVTAGLAIYAFYCYRHGNGLVRLSSSLKIASLAIVFATLGIDISGATSIILQVLGTLGGGYRGLTISFPLL